MLNPVISAILAAFIAVSAAISPPAEPNVPGVVKGDIVCPVITYHDISTPGDGKENGAWRCSAAKFENDIRSLSMAGYNFVSTAELYDALCGKGELPDNPVIIHFDDGYLSNYTTALPILRRYNAKADIFVVTDRIDGLVAEAAPAFTWEQAREMEQSGVFGIYLHGKKHDNATSYTYEQFYNDHADGWQRITDELGQRKVHAYVYPGGEHSPDTLRAAHEFGDGLQFIWCWDMTPAACDYPVFLRMNISEDNDPIEEIERFYSILAQYKTYYQ